MDDPQALWRALDEGRADLLAAVREAPQAVLAWRPPAVPGGSEAAEERWPIRQVLWHVGDAEQRRSFWLGGRLREEATYVTARQPRPAHLNTLPLLLSWLEETRAATRQLLAGLDAATLGRAFLIREDGDTSTGFREWGWLAEHDHEHAAQVRAIRAAYEQGGD